MLTDSMLFQIVAHTPTWVFAVFALLAWRGARQLVTREVSLAGVTVLPLALVGFALYGVASAFGHSQAGLLALVAWVVAAAASGFWMQARPLSPRTQYDPELREFLLPGSPWPLVRMMGIFLTKYVVGVTLVFHPGLAQDSGFALGISALYGLFSGIFAGGALRLWRLAISADRTASLA
ncbi:hypothetical protein ABIC63_000096 [Pseudacidovorax sp. 1753]|uniref:DUF6622 family protein n=1 Tax=unclassified Pseudacidovorax TaxID=2620592 RepID=UPI0025D63BB6|nr:DUF6622 family protein [Pseudacidovorax sp.]